MSNATALCGNILSIHPKIELLDGYLKATKKYRGKMQKVVQSLITDYVRGQNLDRQEIWLGNGEVYLLAASSADEETTRGWIEEMQAFFPGMEILDDKLSLGLSCHTGEGALGIGCSCRPARRK